MRVKRTNAVPPSSYLNVVSEAHLIPIPMAQTDAAVAWIQSLNIHTVVCGAEWQGSPCWVALDAALSPLGIKVIYAPKTEGISSTQLKERIKLGG